MLRWMVHDGFLGSSLLDFAQPSILTQVEEEALWAVVDYNTMSDQDADGTIMEEQTSNGVLLSSWFELFGAVDDSSFPATNTIQQNWESM